MQRRALADFTYPETGSQYLWRPAVTGPAPA
jgi:hypothetical protein